MQCETILGHINLMDDISHHYRSARQSLHSYSCQWWVLKCSNSYLLEDWKDLRSKPSPLSHYKHDALVIVPMMTGIFLRVKKPEFHCGFDVWDLSLEISEMSEISSSNYGLEEFFFANKNPFFLPNFAMFILGLGLCFFFSTFFFVFSRYINKNVVF